jgi:hypothetical protein
MEQGKQKWQRGQKGQKLWFFLPAFALFAIFASLGHSGEEIDFPAFHFSRRVFAYVVGSRKRYGERAAT